MTTPETDPEQPDPPAHTGVTREEAAALADKLQAEAQQK